MMNSIKKTALAGLIAVLTVSATVVSSDDSTPVEKAPPAGKLVPATLEGKVVSIDKSTRLLTVDIKGTIININVLDQVKITRKGKDATIAELAPGQAISVSFLELPTGRIEVAGLNIQPNRKALESAGSPGK